MGLQAGAGWFFGKRLKQNLNLTVDIKDNIKEVDVSLGAGIGYVNLTASFGIDARCNLRLA
jgi:hypothetical protein